MYPFKQAFPLSVVPGTPPSLRASAFRPPAEQCSKAWTHQRLHIHVGKVTGLFPDFSYDK